jgi:hypothetical protein
MYAVSRGSQVYLPRCLYIYQQGIAMHLSVEAISEVAALILPPQPR